MPVHWRQFTQPDGRHHRQIQISDDSSWSAFDQIAQRLETGLRGEWSGKLDGADERYWDLVASEGKLTLHLQHYLGVTLYPTAGADSDTASLDLLEQAYGLLNEGQGP